MTSRWLRLAAWLLSDRVPAERQEEVLGDLSEDFMSRTRQTGRLRAVAWLVRELTSLRWSYRRTGPGAAGATPRSIALDTLARDLRAGGRLLRRDPGFTTVALLTLALSVGANTIIFSVIDATLLQPLPYADADRLVAIVGDNPDHTLKGLNVSFTKLQYLQARARSLVRAGAYQPMATSIVTNGTPEQVPAARVTGNFFDLLHVVPQAGRGFLETEDREGGADVAVITDGFWRGHFGGDPSLVGRQVRLDGSSVTVIGILPPSFRCPCQEPVPEVWFPRAFERPSIGQERVRLGASFLVAIGELAPGETIARAQVELDALNASYRRDFPGQADVVLSLLVDSLKENLVGPLRASLLVLLAAVGLVLLIGCSNIASMLLARGTTRAPEMAVRRALGASRARLVRQLLTESLLLSACGGALGLACAAAGLRLMPLLPVGLLPRVADMHLNGRMLACSLALSAAAGIAFGLMPSLRASRTGLQEGLREGGRGLRGGKAGGRARGLLVVAEVALAVILVTCAGLLLKSFASLVRVAPGFNASRVMTFALSLPATRYAQGSQQAQFYRRLVDDIRAVPAVESAAVSSFLPLGGLRYVYVCPEATVCQGVGRDPVIALRQITPDYFQTLGISVLRGRAFDDHDTAEVGPVAIINATAAAAFFPGQDPVGRHLTQSHGAIRTEIVGVVADVRSRGPNADYMPEMFLPQSQNPSPTMGLVVRANGPAAPLVSAVRSALAALDRDLPISNVSSMDDLVAASVAQPRLTAELTGIFGMAALLLAAIGIYGVLAYTVSQRTQEIGVRLALGAVRRDVLRLVLGQSLRLVIAGVVLGSAASLLATRLLSALLVGTSARDPVTFAGVALLLLAVALAAAYIPARRASRVDPVIALRR